MLGELGFYISWIGTWLIFTLPIWWALWDNTKEEPKETEQLRVRRWWVYDTAEGQKVVCLNE